MDIFGENVGNRGVGNLRFIGLVGLRPASRVFTFHLLDSLLTATTKTYDLVFQQKKAMHEKAGVQDSK